MQRHQSRRDQESPSSFECATWPFITPTKKHWWPRHDWLVSLVSRRGSFLRRFCQQCQRIWQHCSLWPGVDSWFLGIPMSHMWYLPMYVLVCWLLQRRKPWRWASCKIISAQFFCSDVGWSNLDRFYQKWMGFNVVFWKLT